MFRAQQPIMVAASSPQPRPDRAIIRAIAILTAIGLLLAIYFRAGALALVLAGVLGLLLRNRVHKGRTLVEWVAAGALVLLLASGVPDAPRVTVPSPPKVEGAQSQQLTDLREAVDKGLQRVLSLGSDDPREAR